MAAIQEAEVKPKKGAIVVTGVAGFIGSHVAEFLLRRGETVAGLDEVNDYYDVKVKRGNLELLRKLGGDRFTFYEGDICDVDLIERVWAAHGHPRRVVHMAARAGVRPSIENPFVYVQSNVEGTTRLLELARKYGSDSFVFASSSSVYGGSEKEYFSETDTVDFPVSPYAATKKACELMAYTYYHLYEMNIAALRFFTVFGPRGRPDMAPLKFVDSVSRGVTIKQFGDGSSSRDYTYIADIVDGVVLALDTPLGYQVYNLGRGDGTSLTDFIALVKKKQQGLLLWSEIGLPMILLLCRQVEKEVGVKAKIEVLPDQPGDVPRTCADISKARRLLGYDPKTPFPDGIAKLVEWYKEAHPSVDSTPETITRAAMEKRLRLDAEANNWSVDQEMLTAYHRARVLRPSYHDGAATVCGSNPTAILRPRLTDAFENAFEKQVDDMQLDQVTKTAGISKIAKSASRVALDKIQSQVNLDPEVLADFIAAVRDIPDLKSIPALATVCSSRPVKLRNRQVSH